MIDDIRICPRCGLDKPMAQFKRQFSPPALWCSECRASQNRNAHLRIVSSRRFAARYSGSNILDITDGRIAGQLASVFRQIDEIRHARHKRAR